MKKMLQLIVPSLNRTGSEQIDPLYFIVKSNIWYFMVTCTVDSRNEILWRKWFNNRKNDVTHSCYLTPNISQTFKWFFTWKVIIQFFLSDLLIVYMIFYIYIPLFFFFFRKYELKIIPMTSSNFFSILDKTVFGIWSRPA